ncbi:serine-threonine protein kinase, putative [Entamoeba invadens IP1]|uniref:Serine-threonine protein kinase, putative n=1 Tax=Entamoeba invadens IP1 TaxID=370355 RepID=A0A0A1U8T7_ENTIV|nr:serine-threonine protein kinase, putative [Entamoeba invadens IP1]ELP88398.1 serine-threonine protein kinase, putative [Entamoeba invadens IP1]|eukprot:XP_004255169.1 serine-threonine protein kinase, putative [Entamoeba invadens IP1]
MCVFFLFLSFVVSSNVCDNAGCAVCKENVCDTCKAGYNTFNDACDTCQFYKSSEPVSQNGNPLYMQVEGVCEDVSQDTEGRTFTRAPVDPQNLDVTNVAQVVSVNSFSPLIPPCQDTYNTNDYVYGKWISVTLSAEGMISMTDFKIVDNSPVKSTNSSVFVEVATHQGESTECLSSFEMKNAATAQLKLPYTSFYLFVGIKNGKSLEVSFSIVTTEEKMKPKFEIDGNEFVDFIDDNTNHSSTGVPKTRIVGNEGFVVRKMSCYEGFVKGILFAVKTFPYRTIIIDTKQSQTLHYVEELDENFECKALHIGKKAGLTTTENSDDGVLFWVYSEIEETRLFFITLEGEETKLRVQVGCVNKCGEPEKRGQCVLSVFGCLCNSGYGYEECGELCYNGKSFSSGNENGCYLDTTGCTKHCTCEDGYTIQGHYCQTPQCAQYGYSQCKIGEDNCLINCECEEGYVATPTYKCKLVTCGNKAVDYGEDCDGGNHCNELCQCIEGYESDLVGGCEKSGWKWYYYFLLIVGIFIVVIVLIIAIILIVAVNKKTTFDPDTIVRRQPQYFINFEQCQVYEPELDATNFLISEMTLTFGDNEFIDINKTYFNQITFKNLRKKWMLVILHLPNSDKYVFHTEPEVLYIPPHRKGVITLFATLFCTTKINSMKIPTTVFTSKTRSVLNDIAANLKGKTEETYTPDMREEHLHLMKNIKSKFRLYLTLNVEAAASTDIDIDEIKMMETPIGEGTYSTVYLGSYRTIFVAIKTFKLNFTNEEEREFMVNDVKAECDLMKKLRNPNIISYIGSVTYIPQISIIMQYAIFDSLANYCRPAPEGVVLQFKLKMQILKDVSKGMSFLHENSIMHLDLKPDNILLASLSINSDCIAKITDFGTSRIKRNKDKGLGTPLYLAPETYSDVYNYGSDVYSFAITAWELFYEEEPFKEFQDLFSVKSHVLEGNRLPLKDPIPEKLKTVITKCWAQNYEDRPNFGVVSTWMVEMVNSLPDFSTDLDDNVNTDIINALIEKKKVLMEQVLFD